MHIFIVPAFVVALSAVVTSHPSDAEDVFNPLDIRTFTMPESCKSTDSEFCFDKTGYPVDIIEDLVKDLTNLEVAKSDDVGQYVYSNRQGGPDEYDCLTNSTTDPIYFIVDNFGKDRVVVQMKDKFEQHFSVMRCNNEGLMDTNTKHFLKKTVKDYKAYCENKYVQYDFLVLSSVPDFRGKWKMEKARTKTGIPVCCVCKYKKEDK